MITLKKITHSIPALLLIGHLIAGFCFSLYVTWCTDTLGGDTLEHIHSAWLIYAGYVPYKDFFQHHNPLLWYLFAPIAGLHAKGVDDILITNISLGMAVVASFWNYWYLYLIMARFFKTKFGGLAAAAMAFTPYVLLSLVHFRPDNFMMLTFFAGLYHYFAYLETKRPMQLVISFILFWCSFMFLQKIVFTLALMGVISIYLIYKGQMLFKDLCIAAALPFIMSLAYGIYLYENNILVVWYQSNFTFNMYIPDLFLDRRIGTLWVELKCLMVGATLAILFCSKGSNIYFKILAIIFVAEALQRLLYFSAFAYYFFLLVYTACILTAVFLMEHVFKRWWWLTYILAFAMHYSMYEPAIYEGNMGKPLTKFHVPLNKEILQYVNPCDYVLNGDGIIYNLYNRDPHYYWNLVGQTDVIGAKVGIHELMDINEVIEKYRPRIIPVAPFYDKQSLEHKNPKIVHQVRPDIIAKYYKPLGNAGYLYILKPEMAPAKCDYNYENQYYYAHD